MFNLDQAMTEWRRQMTAGGVANPAVLDELESHLREDVERQTRSGKDAKRAFEIAVQNIGPVGALRNEFRKSMAVAIREKLMMGAAILVLAFGIFLSMTTLILCYQSMAERVEGFVVISLSFGTILIWPAFVSRFPVIQVRRKLFTWQATCLAAGFAISTVYVQLVLPHFERGGDRIIPAIGFFACFPIAVGLAVAAGLDRAGRGRFGTGETGGIESHGQDARATR
jgi:hypothetical protein